MYLNTFYVDGTATFYLPTAGGWCKECLDQGYELVLGNSQTVPVVSTLPVSCHLDAIVVFFFICDFFLDCFNLIFLNVKNENYAGPFLAVLYWSTVTSHSTRSPSYAFCSFRMLWMRWEDCGFSLILLLHPEFSQAWQLSTDWLNCKTSLQCQLLSLPSVYLRWNSCRDLMLLFAFLQGLKAEHLQCWWSQEYLWAGVALLWLCHSQRSN